MARGLIVLITLLGLTGVACDGGESAGEPGGSESSNSAAGDSTGGSSTTGGEGSSRSSSGSTTDTPEGSSSEDTSTSGDSSSTGGAPQGVPVIVSVAHGGQTARSCDGGRTWTDFHAYGIQDDHSDYAAFGGIAHGNGVWIAATGWGASGRILRSIDGVNWEDLADDAFVTADGPQRPTNGASGVEFVGDGFVLFAGADLWRSEDGTTWMPDTPASLGFHGHFREVEYLHELGLLLIATEAYEVQGSWTVQVSDDGGASWQVGTGVTSACVGYVQHDGGFAAHDGRLLIAGGTGPTCVSDDGGLSWVEAGDVGSDIADAKAFDGGFVVLAQSGDVFVSEDAEQWSPLGTSGLTGGRIGWHPELGFFGEGNGVYATSPNGTRWTDAETPPPRGYAEVREFAVGRLDACP